MSDNIRGVGGQNFDCLKLDKKATFHELNTPVTQLRGGGQPNLGNACILGASGPAAPP